MPEYIRIYADSVDNNGGSGYRELTGMIERYTDGLIFTMLMQEAVKLLSAAKTPERDGKGNVYADIISHHVPLLDAMKTASRKSFMAAFCS